MKFISILQRSSHAVFHDSLFCVVPFKLEQNEEMKFPIKYDEKVLKSLERKSQINFVKVT